MADRSAIEWTDASWNPIRARSLITGKLGWHCTHASEGCRNCYAEGFNRRLGTGHEFKPQLLGRDVEVFLDEEMLRRPLRWTKPRRIFPGSMSDLFGEFVTDEMLDRIFAVMALTSQHTYQVLTKRAARMRAYVTGRERNWVLQLSHAINEAGLAAWADKPGRPMPCWPPHNVWLGVSAEDQGSFDERVRELLATPAAVRFVSGEPLLAALDIRWTEVCVPGLDWLIAGGESGPNARSMHPEWLRRLRDDCAAAGVAFFFKQWGEFAPADALPSGFRCGGFSQWLPGSPAGSEAMVYKVGKKRAGRLLDGREHNAMPGVG